MLFHWEQKSLLFEEKQFLQDQVDYGTSGEKDSAVCYSSIQYGDFSFETILILPFEERCVHFFNKNHFFKKNVILTKLHQLYASDAWKGTLEAIEG